MRNVLKIALLFISSATYAGDVSTLASPHFTAGWASFGQVLPPGAAKDGLQLGTFPTQIDVKSRWPDGSIRFCVVSAKIDAAGTYPLHAAVPLAGTFTPTLPSARITFTFGTDTYTADLPAQLSSDLWLSGPLVAEARSVVSPVSATLGAHPFLSVVFDLRCYVDGAARLDVTVEDPFDKVGAGQLQYDVDLAINGQNAYHHSAVVHYYLARWRKVFNLNLAEANVTLDFEPWYRAKALPRYESWLPNQTYSTDGPAYDILQRGGLSFNQMNQAGGRPELAPYPDWAAEFLVHQDPTQRAIVLRTGDLSGSQPFHIRETDGSLVSIDARPQFWLDERGKQFVPYSDQPKGNLLETYGGPDPLFADIEHPPSLPYIPYLVTGDRYYADELAFWANYVLLASHPFYNRMNDFGLLGDGSVRAIAWPLRILTDAAVYLPDTYPSKPYFVAKLQNNLHWYDDYANHKLTTGPWTDHGGPSDALGTSFEITSPNSPGYQNKVIISQWQQNFLAWAIGHANDQGFTSGTVLRNRLVAFQNKLFNSGPDYPREYAAPYYPQIGTYDANNNWTYFTSMKQMFDANFRNADGTIIPVDGGQPGNFQGYYGRDARLSLMTATKLGLPGAAGAYQYLDGQLGTNNQPGFAIAFEGASPIGSGPVLSALSNQTTLQDTATPALPFTVSDDQAPLASVQLRATAGNPALVPDGNIILGGSGANRTVQLIPAPGATGSTTISLTASDGAQTATTSFVLTVTPVAPPPPPQPPQILSHATASPNPAAPGASVQFNLGAVSSTGGTLTYAWNFGDGASATGPTPIHSFNAPGSYSVGVIVTDSLGGSISDSVTEVVTTSGANPLTVLHVTGAAKSKAPGHDSCTLTAVLGTLPATFTPSGKMLSVNIDGAIGSFVLDASGRGKSDHGTVVLKVSTPKARGTAHPASTGAQLTVKLQRGSWAAIWGFPSSPQKTIRTLPISVTLDGATYSSDVQVTVKSSAAGAQFAK